MEGLQNFKPDNKIEKTFIISDDYSERVRNFKSVAADYQWNNLQNVVKENSQPPFEKHPKINNYDDLRKKQEIELNQKFNLDGNELEFIPFEKNGKRILLLSPTYTDGRIFIKIKINDIPVTFYNSTGKAKKTTRSGMFYPTLGINNEEMTWINKTDSIDMAMYHGSPILTKAARFIDRKFGNLNDYRQEIELATHNTSASIDEIEKFINSGRKTYENTKENSKNIELAFNKLVEEVENKKLVKTV